MVPTRSTHDARLKNSHHTSLHYDLNDLEQDREALRIALSK
jgi:hypothetical protein